MGIEEYRDEIDRVNESIVEDVSKRMEVVEKIGDYKQRNGIKVRDPDREETVREQFAEKFSERGLSAEKGREIAELLIEMSVEREKR